MYENKHGQEPSSPLPADHVFEPPLPANTHPKVRAHRERMKASPALQRAGFDPIDTAQCQAPIRTNPGNMHAVRCTHPAVCVAVENNPRGNGRIAAMSLCEFHRDAMMRMGGPDYAHLTPLART